MSYWKIAWRNMQQRALASSLTGFSMALGVAVMICVIVIHAVTVKQFSEDAQGYHVIIGMKGGSMQLVLSTVYHLGQPLNPIPYSYYKEFVDGKYADVTEVAVPYCLGDSFAAPNGRMFRVIGTTTDLFDKIEYGTYNDGTKKRYEFQTGGRNFKNENFFEAVIGSVVAAQTGLKVGDTFQPTHGLKDTEDKHKAFTIVGILEPTATANDRALFLNIEGFYLLDGHALSAPKDEETEASTSSDAIKEHSNEAHDHDAPVKPLPENQREVTSILVLCNSPIGPTLFETAINKGEGSIAQSVSPRQVISQLLDQIVGPMQIVLLVLTIMIVIVASISILVSIYNSMKERSHDIAVMRALGASRSAVMGIVLVESILLSLCGGLAGILLGHGIIALASPYIEAHTGIRLGFFMFDQYELYLLPALVVLASLVGFLPALSAYRTDVSKSLAGNR